MCVIENTAYHPPPTTHTHHPHPPPTTHTHHLPPTPPTTHHPPHHHPHHPPPTTHTHHPPPTTHTLERSCPIKSELFSSSSTSAGQVHMRVLLGAIQVASWGQIHWTSQAGKKASDTPTLGELQFSLGITAPPSEPMASVTCCISSGKSGVYQTNHLVCMGQRSAAPLPERMVYLCVFIGVTVTVTPVHLRMEVRNR